MGIPMRWSERGGALTLTAVSLTALIGAAAIAIDLGMLYKARGDAERAAEAGALAGASAFMDLVGADSADHPQCRGYPGTRAGDGERHPEQTGRRGRGPERLGEASANSWSG